MWKYGDVIAWRGIAMNRPWHVQSAIVVKDNPAELVISFLPGAESMAEASYAGGNKNGKRRWDFTDNNWELMPYAWHTNRVLAITEPTRFYSIMLFWHHTSNTFSGYYVNFQLPFTRGHCSIDTLDLDLDIDIEPDLTFYWKDEDDYQQAINHGIITPEWVQGIDNAKPEILERLDKRKYPFDGSWLNWRPDPSWSPPTLPANWDKM